MWHLGNSFCLIAFLSTRKLLILKRREKGQKRDQHCLFAKVRFFWRTVVWRLGERGGWRSGGSSSVGGKQLPGRETGGRQLWSGNAKTERLERAPDSGFRCILGSAWWVPSLSKPDFWWFCLKTQSEKTRVIKVGKEVGHDDVVGGKLGPALQPPLPCILFIFWFWVWLWRRLCTQVIGFGFVEYYRLKILHVLVKGKSSLIDKENRSFLSKPEKLSTSARLSTRKEGWVGRSQYEVRQLSW